MIKTALIGAGGFGWCHLDSLNKLDNVELCAVCDVNPDFRKEFEKQGISFYQDYADMLENESGLDYITVSTPIHTHVAIAERCLRSGIGVFLEKPPAILPQELESIICARDAGHVFCSVNYTMLADPAFIELCEMVRQQKIGEIKNIEGIGMYRRYNSYYQSSPWIGKMKYKESLLRDGTINNVQSHILNNMMVLLDILGDADIEELRAELYHAHSIEGDDTSCFRFRTAGGKRVTFYGSLCNRIPRSAKIRITGDREIIWEYPGKLYIDGKEESFEVEENPTVLMHKNMVEFLQSKAPLICPPERCKKTIQLADSIYQKYTAIHSIPQEFITGYCEEEEGIAIIDLERWTEAARKEGKLYSETECPWGGYGGTR